MQSCSLTGLTNTKDNTINTLKVSAIGTFNNLEIDGPEELHFFNVSMVRNNKKLAYKFERVEEEESTL
jgi:hypothetical protein